MLTLFEKRRDLVFITVDLGYMAFEEVAQAYGERFVNAGVSLRPASLRLQGQAGA